MASKPNNSTRPISNRAQHTGKEMVIANARSAIARPPLAAPVKPPTPLAGGTARQRPTGSGPQKPK